MNTSTGRCRFGCRAFGVNYYKIQPPRMQWPDEAEVQWPDGPPHIHPDEASSLGMTVDEAIRLVREHEEAEYKRYLEWHEQNKAILLREVLPQTRGINIG